MSAQVTMPAVPQPILAQFNAAITPTTLKGLQELVGVALHEDLTGQDIDQLSFQAFDHGTLIIPDTFRAFDEQPDTMAISMTLVGATTSTTAILTRDV